MHLLIFIGIGIRIGDQILKSNLSEIRLVYTRNFELLWICVHTHTTSCREPYFRTYESDW